MVPLTMLFASHDADPSVNGIMLPKKSCCTSLLSSCAEKYNGAIYDVVSIM